MSDTPMGEGWWQASDGRWYPPQPPSAPAPVPEQWPPPSSLPLAPPPGPPRPPTGGPLGPPPGAMMPPPGVNPPSPGSAAAFEHAPAPFGPPAASPAYTVAPPTSRKPRRARKALLATVSILVVMAAGVAAYLVFFDDAASATEVSLESLGATGPDPFTAPVAPEPSARLADFAEKGAPGTTQPTQSTVAAASVSSYRSAQGGVAGIYGGTLDELACDGSQLVSFLEAAPEKASSWASVIEIDPTDIAGYVAGLTPANLAVDTRVINFGYADGAPVARQAVLQRGNAVFVDQRGVPRVNCYSGNPLKEPAAIVQADESFTGSRWPAFSADDVVVIEPAPAPVESFEMIDIESGETFTRPAGAASNTVTPSTTATTADRSSTAKLTPAGAIKAGEVHRGQLSQATPELRYTIDIPDGAVLTLQVTNDRASKAAVAVSPSQSGNRLEFFRVNAGADEEREYIRKHDEGGEYELVFTEGPASFEFRLDVTVQDDGGQDKDAGEEAADALDIAAGSAITGRLGGTDTADRFVVKLQAGTELRLSAKVDRNAGAPARVQLQINGENLYNDRLGAGGEETFSVLLGPKDDDLLDVGVFEGPANYSFTIEFVAQNDAGQAGDAGNVLAQPRTLTSLSDVPGTIGGRDDSDHYVFTATAAELQLKATAAATSAATTFFTVQGPDGGTAAFLTVAPGASGTQAFTAVAGQQYRVVVTNGPSSYIFSVSG